MSTLQQLLEDAAATGRALADRLGQRALRDAAGSVRIVVPLEGEGLPWGVIAQHAQQHSSRRHIWRIREVPDGAPEVSGQEEFGGGSGRSSSRDSQATISSSGRGGSGICQSCGSDFESAQSPADLLPAYHSSSQIPSAAASPQPAPQQAAQQRGHPATPAAASGPAARAALGVAPGAGGCNDIEADLSRLLAGMAITPEQEAAAIAAATATLEAAGVTLGGGGGAPSSALSEGGGAAAGAESRGSAAQGEASDSEGTAALVRRQLVVTALRGSQPWGLVDGGEWHGPGRMCGSARVARSWGHARRKALASLAPELGVGLAKGSGNRQTVAGTSGAARHAGGSCSCLPSAVLHVELAAAVAWACCAAGMVVWQAEGAYCFRGETLKTITYLFRRQVGGLLRCAVLQLVALGQPQAVGAAGGGDAICAPGGGGGGASSCQCAPRLCCMPSVGARLCLECQLRAAAAMCRPLQQQSPAFRGCAKRLRGHISTAAPLFGPAGCAALAAGTALPRPLPPPVHRAGGCTDGAGGLGPNGTTVRHAWAAGCSAGSSSGP